MAKKKVETETDFSAYNGWQLLNLMHKGKIEKNDRLLEQIQKEFSKRDLAKINASIQNHAM